MGRPKGPWRSGGMGWSQSGWKSLGDVDEEAEARGRVMDEKLDQEEETEMDDPWYAGDYEEIKVVEWHDVELSGGGGGIKRVGDQSSKSMPTVISEDRHGHTGPKQVLESSDSSGTGLAGGGSYLARWRSSLDIWRSARRGDIDDGELANDPDGGLPRRKTVRLVEPTYRAIPSRSESRASVNVPAAPGWIVPGSAANLHAQLISPPTQPHLFFHPPLLTQTAQTSTEPGGLRTSDTNGTLGISSYASSSSEETSVLGDVALNSGMRELEQQHDRWPTIPSSATALAQAEGYVSPFSGPQYTNVPLESPPRTPKRRSTMKGEDRTPLAKRTSTMKRSSGRMNLYDEPDSPTPKRRQTAPSLGKNGAASAKATPPGKGNGLLRTPTKSRVQRREDRAQQEVNNILQASWSDRFLASPPQSIDGLVAMTQPSTSFAVLGENSRASSPLGQNP